MLDIKESSFTKDEFKKLVNKRMGNRKDFIWAGIPSGIVYCWVGNPRIDEGDPVRLLKFRDTSRVAIQLKPTDLIVDIRLSKNDPDFNVINKKADRIARKYLGKFNPLYVDDFSNVGFVEGKDFSYQIDVNDDTVNDAIDFAKEFAVFINNFLHVSKKMKPGFMGV